MAAAHPPHVDSRLEIEMPTEAKNVHPVQPALMPWSVTFLLVCYSIKYVAVVVFDDSLDSNCFLFILGMVIVLRILYSLLYSVWKGVCAVLHIDLCRMMVYCLPLLVMLMCLT